MKFWNYNSYYIDIASAWSDWDCVCRGLQGVDVRSLDLSIFRSVDDHVFGERAYLFHNSGEKLTDVQRTLVLEWFCQALNAFKKDFRAWNLHVYFHNDRDCNIGSVAYQFAVKVPALGSGWRSPWLPVSYTGSRPYIATALDEKHVRDDRIMAASLMAEAVREAEARNCEREVLRGKRMLELLQLPLTD